MIGLFTAVIRVPAATYCVTTNGLDTNPGSVTEPWRTIQKAADTMRAGDIVMVGGGDYAERVTTRSGGVDGALITYRARGTVSMKGFALQHPYTVVNGFEITGGTGTRNSGAIAIGPAAHYCQVLNNNIHDLAGNESAHGIAFVPRGVEPADAAAYCLVAGNVLKRTSSHNLGLRGLGHTISNNWFEAPAGDAIRCFGADHVICDNTFSNITVAGAGHPDLIQSFSVHGEIASNIVFERNLAVDCGAQICQITDDGALGRVRDWTFRNNIFIRVAAAANNGFPGARWHNNVFYQCTRNTAHVLLYSYASRSGPSWRGEVMNNVFLECGPTSGDAKRGGWYRFDPDLPDFVADHNYVGGQGGAPKNTGCPRADRNKFCEPKGINGGDPGFIDPAAGDFRLKPGSILIDKATSIPGYDNDFSDTPRPQGDAWDIGAFEWIP
jgi:hypothetical protein